jgi:hypothetical protein
MCCFSIVITGIALLVLSRESAKVVNVYPMTHFHYLIIADELLLLAQYSVTIIHTNVTISISN